MSSKSHLSGRHARLSRSGSGSSIEDLASSNGTFVNGRKVEGVASVREGDVIGPGVYSGRPRDRAGRGRRGWPVRRESTPHAPVARACAAPLSRIRRGRRGDTVDWARPGAPAAPGARHRGGDRAGRPGAPMLSWPAPAAVWFGLSDVILGDLAYRGRLRRASIAGDPRPLLLDLGLIAGLCAVQCAPRLGDGVGAGGVGGCGPPVARVPGAGLGRGDRRGARGRRAGAAAPRPGGPPAADSRLVGPGRRIPHRGRDARVGEGRGGPEPRAGPSKGCSSNPAARPRPMPRTPPSPTSRPRPTGPGRAGPRRRWGSCWRAFRPRPRSSRGLRGPREPAPSTA